MSPVLTTKEVAEILQVDPGKVRRLTAAVGTTEMLDPMKLHRLAYSDRPHLYDRREVLRFMRAQSWPEMEP